MKPKNVDDYIASVPKEFQGRLKDLRAAIKKVAPEAEEKISYGMPYYGYKGRLVYFQLWPKHIGIYLPPPVIEEFKKELKNYVTAKATVQFPNAQKLPISLIKKLVKARVKINDEFNKKK